MGACVNALVEGYLKSDVSEFQEVGIYKTQVKNNRLLPTENSQRPTGVCLPFGVGFLPLVASFRQLLKKFNNLLK